VLSTFTNCAALADANDGAWGWAPHADADAARNLAISTCQQYTNTPCSIRANICADGSVTQ